MSTHTNTQENLEDKYLWMHPCTQILDKTFKISISAYAHIHILDKTFKISICACAHIHILDKTFKISICACAHTHKYLTKPSK